MKILFSSDIHHHTFGQFAVPTPYGRTSRIEEGLAAESFVLDLIQTEQIDLAVMAGDLFHVKDVIPAVVFNDIYELYAVRPCESILLCGNHDIAAGGVRNTLESFGQLKNVRVMDTARIVSPCLGVYIHCVPYFADPEQRLAAFDNLRAAERNGLNILVAHVQVAGARTGSEFLLPETFTTAELHADRFDFCLLGHIHRAQEITGNVWYIGNLLQRSFADEGCPGRVAILDTDTAQLRFIPVPGPTFLTVTAPSLERLAEWIPVASFAREIEHDVTKKKYPLYLRVRVADPRITLRTMADALDGWCNGHVVVRETQETAEREEVQMHQAGMQWSEVVGGWVKTSETPLDKDRLTALGLGIVEETLKLPEGS